MKQKLNIKGMKCEGCANRIKMMLSKEKGIIFYDLSLDDKSLLIEVKKEKTLEEIIKKIEVLGFEVFK